MNGAGFSPVVGPRVSVCPGPSSAPLSAAASEPGYLVAVAAYSPAARCIQSIEQRPRRSTWPPFSLARWHRDCEARHLNDIIEQCDSDRVACICQQETIGREISANNIGLICRKTTFLRVSQACFLCSHCPIDVPLSSPCEWPHMEACVHC